MPGDFLGGPTRSMFVAGVMDWISDCEPTAEAISRVAVLAHGSAHLRAIQRSGGQVLGIAPLAEGGAIRSTSESGVPRSQDATDMTQSPATLTWGYGVPRRIVEGRFRIADS